MNGTPIMTEKRLKIMQMLLFWLCDQKLSIITNFKSNLKRRIKQVWFNGLSLLTGLKSKLLRSYD
jgi:hypothetical protein